MHVHPYNTNCEILSTYLTLYTDIYELLHYVQKMKTILNQNLLQMTR